LTQIEREGFAVSLRLVCWLALHGNRQLNRALHVTAVTQIPNDTPGPAYYQRKLDEAKTRKEALRALKRQIAKTVYQHLIADTRP
jgi:transposase